jgi:hypothetical protein
MRQPVGILFSPTQSAEQPFDLKQRHVKAQELSGLLKDAENIALENGAQVRPIGRPGPRGKMFL